MAEDLPLTWENDPIYFDKEVALTTHWLNANELLAQKKDQIFISKSKKLSLFPIMVRRSDFLRKKTSDRILARFPYVKLTEEEKTLFRNQELIVAERLRDYFYKSDNRRILEWRDILRKDLKRGFVPLPFLRCSPEKEKFDLTNRSFESARGEAFQMPTKLTKELAYLAGMVNGDGSLKKYVLSIVDYSIDNIRQLKEQFEKLFAQTGRIQLQTENSPTLIITNLWVVRLFSFLTSQPIGGKKYHALREPLIFQEQPLRSHYWSGVMDADGSYVNRTVKLVSASAHYIEDFRNFLKTIKIKSKYLERGDGTYQVYIPRAYHHIYKKHMTCLHPEKKLDFHKLKQGREKNETNAKLFTSFDRKKLVNSYFNFELLDGIHVYGIGEKLRLLRGKQQKKDFSKKIGISSSIYSRIESNKQTVSIEVLRRVLKETSNFDLMPWLFSLGRIIQFRRGNAQPIYLDIKPSTELEYLAKKLIFYPTSIRVLPNTSNDLINKIETRFGIEVKENLITNRVLNHYFTTFCLLEAE